MINILVSHKLPQQHMNTMSACIEINKFICWRKDNISMANGGVTISGIFRKIVFRISVNLQSDTALV